MQIILCFVAVLISQKNADLPLALIHTRTKNILTQKVKLALTDKSEQTKHVLIEPTVHVQDHFV